MHRTRPGRTALAALALLAVAAIAAASAGATAPAPTVTVRVEGTTSTLLLPTSVTLKPGNVDSDGVAGHTCSGLTAAGAIELATHGNWKGTWSQEPARLLHLGDRRALAALDRRRILGVLGQRRAGIAGDLRIQAQARRQHPVLPRLLRQEVPAQRRRARREGAGDRRPRGARRRVTVTAYSDAAGKPSPKAGATVSGGGASAKTAAGGAATITFAKPGRFWLRGQRRPHHAHGGPHLRAHRDLEPVRVSHRP